LPVKHALSAVILATTARKLAGITSELTVTQALACSSVLGLGVDRANEDVTLSV
jgi:biotin-(acetyl-CoA carboxylase) ligase